MKQNKKKTLTAAVWILAVFDGIYIFGMLFSLFKELLRFDKFSQNAIGIKKANVVLFFLYNIFLIIWSERYSVKGKWLICTLALLGLIIFLSGAIAFL